MLQSEKYSWPFLCFRRLTERAITSPDSNESMHVCGNTIVCLPDIRVVSTCLLLFWTWLNNWGVWTKDKKMQLNPKFFSWKASKQHWLILRDWMKSWPEAAVKVDQSNTRRAGFTCEKLIWFFTTSLTVSPDLSIPAEQLSKQPPHSVERMRSRTATTHPLNFLQRRCEECHDLCHHCGKCETAECQTL